MKNMAMNIQQSWSDVLAQRADEIREYFHADAYVNWHCTGEHFTVEEFILTRPTVYEYTVHEPNENEDLKRFRITI